MIAVAFVKAAYQCLQRVELLRKESQHRLELSADLVEGTRRDLKRCGVTADVLEVVAFVDDDGAVGHVDLQSGTNAAIEQVIIPDVRSRAAAKTVTVSSRVAFFESDLIQY